MEPLNPHKRFKRSASFAAKRLRDLLLEDPDAYRDDTEDVRPDPDSPDDDRDEFELQEA